MAADIAFVVSRLHETILGGAERHALSFAHLLMENYSVEILTTTARDYTTWKNEFPEGSGEIDGIPIRRFRNTEKRNLKKFNQYYETLLKKKDLSAEDCEKWLRMQGPYSPSLTSYIREKRGDYKLFFYVSYLYFPIIEGLKITGKNSILLPTLHDEPAAKFPIYKNSFNREIGYSFNTPEELKLFEQLYGFTPPNYAVVGMNLNEEDYRIAEYPGNEYALYLGRLDGGKNVMELLDYWTQFRIKTGSSMKLYFTGERPLGMVPQDGIKFLGFISENEKKELLSKAAFLINPSPLESFSIVVMEAWLSGVPVLVNAASEVLRMHCVRSNGGLWYRDQESFSAIAEYMEGNPNIRRKMGIYGQRYVAKNYNRSLVKEKLIQLIEAQMRQ